MRKALKPGFLPFGQIVNISVFCRIMADAVHAGHKNYAQNMRRENLCIVANAVLLRHRDFISGFACGVTPCKTAEQGACLKRNRTTGKYVWRNIQRVQRHGACIGINHFILTDAVYQHHGTPSQRSIHRATPDAIAPFAKADGAMGPKVAAVSIYASSESPPVLAILAGEAGICIAL